jgi:hypothetical protein
MCTLLALAAFGLTTPACGDDDDGETDGDAGGREDSGRTPRPESIEIAGTWSSAFGDVTIDDDTWRDSFITLEIVAFDNADNFAITQNPDDLDAGAGLFSKNVWTEPTRDGFFFCTVEFNVDSAEDAENSRKTADDSDPASGGCGMFPWTELTPK